MSLDSLVLVIHLQILNIQNTKTLVQKLSMSKHIFHSTVNEAERNSLRTMYFRKEISDTKEPMK